MYFESCTCGWQPRESIFHISSRRQYHCSGHPAAALRSPSPRDGRGLTSHTLSPAGDWWWQGCGSVAWGLLDGLPDSLGLHYSLSCFDPTFFPPLPWGHTCISVWLPPSVPPTPAPSFFLTSVVPNKSVTGDPSLSWWWLRGGPRLTQWTRSEVWGEGLIWRLGTGPSPTQRWRGWHLVARWGTYSPWHKVIFQLLNISQMVWRKGLTAGLNHYP